MRETAYAVGGKAAQEEGPEIDPSVYVGERYQELYALRCMTKSHDGYLRLARASSITEAPLHMLACF